MRFILEVWRYSRLILFTCWVVIELGQHWLQWWNVAWWPLPESIWTPYQRNLETFTGVHFCRKWISYQSSNRVWKLRSKLGQYLLRVNVLKMSCINSNIPATAMANWQQLHTNMVCISTFKYMMTSSNGNIFRVTSLLRGEFIGHRWTSLTKANDAELLYFLWFASGQTIEQTIETPVIWDAIALIMTSM